MFFCGPEKDAKKRVEKLGDLKQLVETIEEKMLVPCSVVCCPFCAPLCPPLCPPPCPPLCLPNQEVVKTVTPPALPPDVMVCYKIEKCDGKQKAGKNGRNSKKDCKNKPTRTKRAKSRELRGGILYVGCDCEKRNGLQDDCPRTGCHGSPECLTKPEPICGPSEFSNGKHLYYKRFAKEGNGAKGAGNGDSNDCNGEKENNTPTIHYNCYPATIQC